MIITFSFNYITLLLMMLADCCMPRRREWCTMEAKATAAAMVHWGWFVCFT
jgi:hypothetical protein